HTIHCSYVIPLPTRSTLFPYTTLFRSRGYPQGPVEVIGKTSKDDTGTSTTFKYDPEIFKGDLEYRFETLVQRFREMAFVTRGVTDRKSTRLNSSHVKISYAVFCLKKKT